jgi:hypothetical protein
MPTDQIYTLDENEREVKDIKFPSFYQQQITPNTLLYKMKEQEGEYHYTVYCVELVKAKE